MISSLSETSSYLVIRKSKFMIHKMSLHLRLRSADNIFIEIIDDFVYDAIKT